MQLNITTDYAIRTVLYLAIQGKITPSNEISERMGIPKNYLLKITRKLSEAGIISRHKGIYGGFALKKKPKEITLLDIIEIMEGTTKINRCLEEDEYCSRFATDTCPVRSFYASLQGYVRKKMSDINMETFLNEC